MESILENLTLLTVPKTTSDVIEIIFYLHSPLVPVSQERTLRLDCSAG